MKLKIRITGPKVHDVGYRPRLVELAISKSLRGLDVYNDEEMGQQTVIALIEADDQRIKSFLNTVKKNKPQLAEVSNITSEDYAGDVMPLWQTAAMNAYGQMNKAVPILQAIKDNTDKIKDNTDMIPSMAKNTEQILEEVRGIREDQPSFALQLKQLQQDVQAIKAQLGMQ